MTSKQLHAGHPTEQQHHPTVHHDDQDHICMSRYELDEHARVLRARHFRVSDVSGWSGSMALQLASFSSATVRAAVSHPGTAYIRMLCTHLALPIMDASETDSKMRHFQCNQWRVGQCSHNTMSCSLDLAADDVQWTSTAWAACHAFLT